MTESLGRPLALKPAPGKPRHSALSAGGEASVELRGGLSNGSGSVAANAGRTRRDGGERPAPEFLWPQECRNAAEGLIAESRR
ncbi:MAG: hypothetical protein OXI25_03960, partial [Chloroflexota bacterium]|nr:hypothetical protein [Chloroflexota bacterium]